MPYLGNTSTQQTFTPAIDVFSGNGSTTAFTLSRTVATVAQVEAFIENVPQSPVDAFTVSGNTITFTSAPPSGSSNIYVRYTSPVTQTIKPSDGSVTTNTLSNRAVTAAKMANSGVELGSRNRIINGAMVIDQRNAGASATPTTTGYVSCDRWNQWASASSKYSVQRSTTAPAGFVNSQLITSLSAYSVLTGDYFALSQQIEGNNIADLGWGAVGASAVTLSFWVRSSLTGTFGASVSNSAANRSYPFSYTINAANTWEQKTVTIAGDTSGTWLTDTGIGLRLWFGLGVGSTYSGTAGAWAAGDYRSVTGATSVVGTNGATFYITGVQLEAGSNATPFEYRSYGTELALCQRYFCQFGGQAAYEPLGLGCGNSTTQASFQIPLPVPMRTAPTGVTVLNVANISGAFGTPSSLVFDTAGYSIAMLTGTYSASSGGLALNAGGRLYAGGSTAPRIQFSTEL